MMLLGALALAPTCAAEKYPDQPAGLTAKGVALIASYEKQAIKTLPHFDEELKRPEGRAFYIITKLYEGKLFEQVYVRVLAKEADGYRGRIASESTGKVTFKRGAEKTVALKEVADWCIVTAKGDEEGNLTGKAIDALQAGKLIFVVGMKPDQGQFARFAVASVMNPQSRQAVGEIVPPEVMAAVEKSAKAKWAGKKAEDEKERYVPVIVDFPEWRINDI